MTPSADPGPRPEDELGRISAGLVNDAEDRAIKRGHLRHFAGAARVLDVGCGGGTFLDLLHEAGIAGLGIDASRSAAAQAGARGHRVVAGDALELVRRLIDERERFDGAFVSHLVEHLMPAQVLELLGLLGRVLTPTGRLVVVTPNVRNLIVLEELFWLDPTHLRPYPRRLLAQLGTAGGLRVVASYDDPRTVPRRGLLRRLVARLRSALAGADRSAPLDAVVVFARA